MVTDLRKVVPFDKLTVTDLRKVVPFDKLTVTYLMKEPFDKMNCILP